MPDVVRAPVDVRLTLEANPAARYFTVEEATRTLPLVRRVVGDIVAQFGELLALEKRAAAAKSRGASADHIDNLRIEAEAVEARLLRLVGELEPIGCQLKDPRRGLIDFPAMHDGRQVLLCWQLDEAEIGFWHDVDAGFAGRRPVSEL